MEKSRVEFFSDAVFAIVITLLILDIHIPEVPYSQLPQALMEIVPKLTSYLLSFTVIGLYWVGHHYYFRFVKKVNNVLLWLNLFNLLLVSFLPIPTSLLGSYPYQPIPIFIYGLNLLALNLFALLVLTYLHTHKSLMHPEFTDTIYKRFIRLFLIINGAYLVALSLSFIVPVVSFIMFIVILAYAIKIYAIRES
jgi:uncharacterized membrane protein